jgi:hypothetical protein
MIDTWLTEEYFRFLKSETFLIPSHQAQAEQVLRVLHDIPFVWLIHSDDNRAGDALAYRQSEFLDSVDTRGMDQMALGRWAMGSPSVLEVLLGMSHRWCFFFGGPSVAYYFEKMFTNMGFATYCGHLLTGREQGMIRHQVDRWLMRQFEENGVGSPFPLRAPHVDQRNVDMWAQMNAYSAEHFQ